MNIRTVLVTVTNGFIGRQLTKGLLSEDVRVRCMVRKSAKRSKALSKQYMMVA
jgi:nucleoside-diphosphate-sugar epimerase